MVLYLLTSVFFQSPVWKSVVLPPNISKSWPYRCSFFLHIQPMLNIDRGAKKQARSAARSTHGILFTWATRRVGREKWQECDPGCYVAVHFHGELIWDTFYNMGYICYNMLYIYTIRKIYRITMKWDILFAATQLFSSGFSWEYARWWPPSSTSTANTSCTGTSRCDGPLGPSWTVHPPSGIPGYACTLW